MSATARATTQSFSQADGHRLRKLSSSLFPWRTAAKGASRLSQVGRRRISNRSGPRPRRTYFSLSAVDRKGAVGPRAPMGPSQPRRPGPLLFGDDASPDGLALAPATVADIEPLPTGCANGTGNGKGRLPHGPHKLPRRGGEAPPARAAGPGRREGVGRTRLCLPHRRARDQAGPRFPSRLLPGLH